jgi:hypothetical protein
MRVPIVKDDSGASTDDEDDSAAAAAASGLLALTTDIEMDLKKIKEQVTGWSKHVKQQKPWIR